MDVEPVIVYIIKLLYMGIHAKRTGTIEINVIIHAAILGPPTNFLYTFAFCIVEQAFFGKRAIYDFFSSSAENL